MSRRTDLDVIDLNAWFVDMLRRMALQDAEPAFEIVRQMQTELRDMTPEIAERMAQRPSTLMTLRLQDPTWWRGVLTSDAAPEPKAWRSTVPRAEAVRLTRALLTLAMRTLHAQPVTFAVARFGMTTSVAQLIASLPMASLERIADIYAGELLPRWDAYRIVWTRLLKAARSGEACVLHHFDLLAAQVLVGELLTA